MIQRNTPPADLYERYEDPSGDFDSQELKYSLWFVRHKSALYRAAVVCLVLVSAVEWVYTIGALGAYAVNWQRDQALTRSLTQFIDYTKFYPQTMPKPLAVLSTQIMPGGVKKSDIVSEVLNPNERFRVTFDYHYLVGGIKTPSARVTLLPLDDELLPIYGLSDEQYPGDATLVVENQQWQRINSNNVRDPKAWQAERLNFEVKNFEFIAAENPDSAKTNVVRFDYVNNSAYSYTQPHFVVGFYFRQALVGVQPLVLPSFTTAETKQVDLRTFVDNLTVDEVKVFPTINVYDPAVYLPPPH